MAHKKIERKKELDRRRKRSSGAHQGSHPRSPGCRQEQQVDLSLRFSVPGPFGTKQRLRLGASAVSPFVAAFGRRHVPTADAERPCLCGAFFMSGQVALSSHAG